MQKSTGLFVFAFILLIIGTIGHLINEFIFDWGRLATVRFTIFNAAGLAILAFERWGKKKTL
ncbi:hypothetical protein ACFLWL_00540 [Chloroflexota bacterium]